MAHSRPSKNNKDKLPAGGGRKNGRITPRYSSDISQLRYNTGKGRGKKPATPRSRREYYRKKEEIRKRRAKKRAFVLCTILMIIVTAAIIGIFIFRGWTAQQPAAPQNDIVVATEPSTVPPYTPATVELPELEDDGSDGYTDGGIYIWNSKGFDIFKGDEKSALLYSTAVGDFKEALGSDITVYNMVVPNHTAYGLPDRLSSEIGSNPQRDNLTIIYSNYGEQVIPVDIYNQLGQKRNDYIFYNTDNRWTSLGAYQAYTAFAKTAGFDPISLDELDKNTIENYSGSYIKSTDNEDLQQNLDTIEYYTISGEYECSVIERSVDGTTAQQAEDCEMYKTKLDEGEDELDVFAYGDNPLFIVDNVENNDGNKLLVIKDTFGSAIVPYLAANYDEVHVIDFRYYEGSVKDYCNKKGIKNVLFLNGIMSANSAAQVNKLSELF